MIMETNTQGLWEALHHNLQAYIARRVPSREDGEDLLQEAFLRFHRAKPGENQNLAAWIYVVVKNLIVDYYRKKNQASPLEMEDLPDPQRFEVSETEQEVSGWLRGMASELPPHYSRALIAADFERKTMKDIANQEGISVSGAKSRVQRGRSMLAKVLHDCCSFHFDRDGRVIAWKSNKKPCCKKKSKDHC